MVRNRVAAANKRRPSTMSARAVPRQTLQGLESISTAAVYPAGAVLFSEGQKPRGVFLLAQGKVKLSGGSAEGRSFIFRIAEAGEFIGLPGALSSKPYESTAQALELTEANFIRCEDFLLFLRQDREAALRVAELLSEIYRSMCQAVRYLGLSGSAAEKLARFLLDLTAACTVETGHPRTVLTLTHAEIGERIGTSRETVTRLFAKFKRKRFIEVHGSILLIRNRLGLESLLRS